MAAVMDGVYAQAAEITRNVRRLGLRWDIRPYWINHGHAFWYRRTLTDKRHDFILVDLQRQQRRTAFNHVKLATALAEQSLQADEQVLPFQFIRLSDDLQTVHFKAGGKQWQFQEVQGLVEDHGKAESNDLEPMDEEDVSGTDTEETSITFVNELDTAISLYWIDWHDKAKFRKTIPGHQSSRRQTYVSHVWRVCHEGTGQHIASYQASAEESLVTINADFVAAVQDKQDNTEQTRVFIDSHNVWQRAAPHVPRGGGNVQLSRDGSVDHPYDPDKVFVSPDERFAVVYQYIPEQQHQVYEIETSPRDQVQPKLKQFQYLKPGDQVRIDQPKLFDLQAGRPVSVDSSLFASPFSITSIGWLDDSGEYLFLYNQRGHQVLSIVAINTEGRTRAIVLETSDTFIDYSQKQFHLLLQDTNEVIWASERDGWNHLYLYDLRTGQVKAQMTKGPWIVASIDHADDRSRRLWLKAYGVVDGEDPYHAHLVRINFDGTERTVLTSGDGTHSWTWTPDRRQFIDTWSRVDLAPLSVVRDAETGKPLVELEIGSYDALKGVGWTLPERFAAPGRDGKTLIYGIIIRPSHRDPGRTYPVIEQIYAGPQNFYVPKAFTPLTQLHELAELGFVVVQIDGMGTNFRSKAFHDVCFKNLKDSGLPDRIAWMRAAGRDRPWMDLDRVGIYGGSAGGQSALAALLWHGDFYTVAVADCGCHDNRMDKLWWNEQWMGWPVDSSYEASSNVVHAHRLTGTLLLIVAELDDNVDPASTMQVANALTKAGKDYDLLIMTGEHHGVGSYSPYAVRRQTDFFVKHLRRATPPDRNKS